MTAALHLGHSNRTLRILTAILEQNQHLGTSQSSGNSIVEQSRLLAPFVKAWDVTQLEIVAGYLLEWNTNARHSFVSQCVLQALLECHGVNSLLNVRALSTQLSALIAYSERHFLRIDRLHQAAYVLEYMSAQMSLLPQAEDSEVEKSGVDYPLGVIKAANTKVVNNKDNGPLDLFGGQATSNEVKKSGNNESENESDSDGSVDSETAMRAAAQASYSGMVASDTDGDDEDDEQEEVSKKKQSHSENSSKKGRDGNRTLSKRLGKEENKHDAPIPAKTKKPKSDSKSGGTRQMMSRRNEGEQQGRVNKKSRR